MVRKNKLDLLNSRLELNETARVIDSLDYREYPSIPLNDGGVHIPFMSKQKTSTDSDFMAWKRGKIKGGGSQNAPVIDNKGNYCEVSKVVELGPSTVHISSREYNEYDYQNNDTARIFYCQKKRIDTPAMNRIMDNTHEVLTETLKGRVERGLVAGGEWTTVSRNTRELTNSIGPGHYNTFTFEAKYGPGSSNLLQFLTAASGRDVDENNRQPTRADRKKSRRLLTAGGDGSNSAHEDYRDARPLTSGLMGATSSLSTTRGISFGEGGDRWKSPLYRVEKYVKTTGATLAPDYDTALREREKIPPKFTTMPQRYEPKKDRVDIEVNVDYGHMASLATATKLSPVKYSMAFRSKDPVGLHIALPTSPPHIGPGAFPVPSSLEVKFPDRPSYAFIAYKGSSFPNLEELPGTLEQVKLFSDYCSKGPKFSKAGTGAGLVLKQKIERQVKTIYPKLAKSLYYKPVVEKIDPWKHLRPKKK